jgi:metal-sulfur cluster biosynthetic enzyme
MQDFDKNKIAEVLEGVSDPEIPVLTIADLGIIRDKIKRW